VRILKTVSSALAQKGLTELAAKLEVCLLTL
jgi:hypothetical protein